MAKEGEQTKLGKIIKKIRVGRTTATVFENEHGRHVSVQYAKTNAKNEWNNQNIYYINKGDIGKMIKALTGTLEHLGGSNDQDS